jgi:hypothetical protein
MEVAGLPPVPRNLPLGDPRLQVPPSRVGVLVTDPESEPGWTGIVTWDPTYRNPGSWGFSRGLLMADEGGANFLRF